MDNKKVFRIINLIFPAMIIFLLTYTSFSMTDDLTGTGLILNSIIIYFPFLYLIQGIASALLKSNIFLTLGISTIAFILVIFIWLNSSAFVYILTYILVGSIGYIVTRWLLNRKTVSK